MSRRLRAGIPVWLAALLLASLFSTQVDATHDSSEGASSKWPPGAQVGQESPLAKYVAGSLSDRIDRLVRLGFDHPQQALTDLASLEKAEVRGASPMREVLLARGLIGAFGGFSAEASASAEALLQLAQTQGTPLAAASSNLVRAALSSHAGQQATAGALAQTALDTFNAACASSRETCDYRAAWLALHLLDSRAVSLGMAAESQGLLRSAVDWAHRAQDPFRHSLSLANLSFALQRSDKREAAAQLMSQAQDLAQAHPDPRLQARILSYRSQSERAQGSMTRAVELMERALTMAESAQASHQAANILTNLSDLYSVNGQPQLALASAQRAIGLLTAYNNRRALWVLRVNAALAKVQLGRISEAKRDIQSVLTLLEQDAALSDQAEVLQEFGAALSAAGDAKGALALYHEERRIAETLLERDRLAAQKEMQARFDSESRQESIALAERENALKAEQLSSTQLRQRVWLLAALVLALFSGLLVWLYFRLRKAHSALYRKQIQLKRQSERDPLTNLANRRHFLGVLKERWQSEHLHGALLLMDIDHFKPINDDLGHPVGDQVLRVISKRLNATVRAGDLAARWGGEEFLIWAHQVSQEQLEQMAQRLLQTVAGQEIAIEGREQALRVTVSIGFARFPLPTASLPLDLTHAVDMVDAALYASKRDGRNCATGIQRSTCTGIDELREACSAFDIARRDGRLDIQQFFGPGGAVNPP